MARCGWHEACEEACDAALAVDDGDGVEEAAHAGLGAFAVVDTGEGVSRDQGDFVGEEQEEYKGGRYSCVLMDSVGVTASKLSVTPAAKPASIARGPVTLPSASASMRLYWSKATNPVFLDVSHEPVLPALEKVMTLRMPALAELPIISVVHPAYHCAPNGGQGSFFPSGRRRLSCVLVLATVQHVYQFLSSIFLRLK